MISNAIPRMGISSSKASSLYHFSSNDGLSLWSSPYFRVANLLQVKAIHWHRKLEANCTLDFRGHVLVLPKRNIPRLADLDKEETVDLMLSAQKIGNVVEKHYGCSSLTMTIQDGPQAGQTVPHVHMHIIPRKAGDWANNDDIYQELDKKKLGVDNEERKPRTEQEMSAEASELRPYFSLLD